MSQNSTNLDANFPQLKHVLIAIIAFILIILGWYFRTPSKNLEVKEPPLLVEVASAKMHHNIPLYLLAVGNVTPKHSVALRAQVSGRISKIFFHEGQKVKKNQLLVQIDEKPYEAEVTKAKGQLLRDQALLENAQKDLARYEALWKKKSISKQILDTQRSLVKQYQAQIKIDQANLENAQINLSYCKITAPIDGRVGLIQVDEGNFIQSVNEAPIVLINSTDPMTVVFSIPEVELAKVIKQFYQKKDLEVLISDNQNVLATGKLYALDNQIDANTGTLKLKAIFDNKENKLFPNQFANVKLLVDNIKQAIMVPIAAICYDKDGQYLYKITSGNVATKVAVELGVAKDDLVLVTSGIAEDDQVIISGTDKITPGMIIRINDLAKNAALAELDYQGAS